jgi:hypothetical protein
MIYTLCNSHAHFFSNSHPGDIGQGKNKSDNFTSYSANFHNPEYRHVLAHKFMERFYPYFINYINQLSLTASDYIMFVVGEIDCRWHMPKQATIKSMSNEQIVKNFMDDFFPALMHLKESGYNVIGWGGHASTNRGHSDDPDNPIYGNCINRNDISLYWNNELKARCENANIKFVSIIEKLIDSRGFTKMEYYMDDYHLTQKAMPMTIEAFQKEKIILC